MTNDIDDVDTELPKALPWGPIMFSVLLLFGFMPVGTITGLCTLGLGEEITLSGLIKNGLFFGIYLLGIHAFLVWPVCHWIYPYYGERWSKAVRLLVVTAFLSLPLISFFNYMADSRALMGWYELLLMAVPAIVIAAMVYEMTEKPWVFSLYLAFMTFIPLSLINDQLGFYDVWIQYAAREASFYLLRIFFPVLAVVVVAWFPASDEGEPLEWVKNFRVLMICLAVLSLLVTYVVPLFSKNSVSAWGYVDYAWLIYPVIIVSLSRRSPLSYRILFILAAGMFVWVVGQLAYYFLHLDTSMWKLSFFGYYLIVLSTFSWLLWILKRKNVRELFNLSGEADLRVPH